MKQIVGVEEDSVHFFCSIITHSYCFTYSSTFNRPQTPKSYVNCDILLYKSLWWLCLSTCAICKTVKSWICHIMVLDFVYCMSALNSIISKAVFHKNSHLVWWSINLSRNQGFLSSKRAVTVIRPTLTFTCCTVLKKYVHVYWFIATAEISLLIYIETPNLLTIMIEETPWCHNDLYRTRLEWSMHMT